MASRMQVLTILLVLIISFCAEVDAAAPVFVNPPPTGGSGSQAENVAVGSVILVLNANDADGDPPSFSIVSQTPSSPAFSINPLDQLQVPSGLDYETTKVFYFVFRVTDGSSSAETQYNLTITNVDDEPPKFAKPSYSTSISELAPTGTTVLQVTATDPDSDSITLSISGAQTSFAIDPVTGVITVKNSSQLATYIGSSVTLAIIASDAANHIATTNAAITVTASPCRNNQCRNGGTCSVEAGSNFKCHCLSGYKGMTCESVDYCFNKPCQNNGDCTSGQSTYSCKCQFCFNDQNCSTPINPCDHGNCKNNRCECYDGYTGTTCDIEPVKSTSTTTTQGYTEPEDKSTQKKPEPDKSTSTMTTQEYTEYVVNSTQKKHNPLPEIVVAILCACGCGCGCVCYIPYKIGILSLKCLCICCECCQSLEQLPAPEQEDKCSDDKENSNRCSLLLLDAKYVLYKYFNNNPPPDDLRNRISESERKNAEDGKECGGEAFPSEGADVPLLHSNRPDVHLRRPCFWCNHCSYCKRDNNRWVYSVKKAPWSSADNGENLKDQTAGKQTEIIFNERSTSKNDKAYV